MTSSPLRRPKIRERAWFFFAIFLTPTSLAAQEFPPDFVIKNVASGAKFELPVGIAFAPDDRIFVTEKKGKVFVIHDGDKIPEPFIDLEREVLSQHDQGLLGIAVDPNFGENRWVYLLYVADPTKGKDNDEHAFSRLTRYRAQEDNLNRADLSSRQVLLGKDWRDGFIACSDQHVIGTLRYALDGTLLVSAGEAAVPGIPDAGGHHPDCFADGRFDSAEDVGSFRSQYIGSLAGKILRIDPNTGLGLPSNPYFTGDPADNESRIWAYGLRNPFRFDIRPNGSTDPADGQPGSVYIGDVGWNQYEDLNVAKVGGENFGWPCFEGPESVEQYRREDPQHSGCETLGSEENPATHTLPLVYWHHTDPNKSSRDGLIGSSVTGGAFYTGNSYPAEYWGGYFFADFVEGWIKVLKVDSGDNVVEINDFATLPGGYFEHGVVDIQSHPENGDLFYVDITAGEIIQVTYTGTPDNQAPVAIAVADTLWGHTPLTVQFSGRDSYDPDGNGLTYRWDFGTGDTSTEVEPAYTFQNSGDYTVRLTVTDPDSARDSFVLQVIAGSVPPKVTILSPEDGLSIYTDERIVLEGSASDADEVEGNLKYEWIVDLHHNTHVHPSSILLEGKMATFVPGNHGDPWDIIYLEAKLKVTDSSGLRATTKRYVVLKIRGERDITDLGTPIALVTQPTGDGNKSIEVIRDGVYPQLGSTDPLTQYDTFTAGGSNDEDWIGFEFEEEHRFSKIIFQEGMHFPDGGWFDVLNAQIRHEGVWKDGFFLNSVPPYRKNNGIHFDTQTLVFTPETGDAIRIHGLPGGSNRYISVGELRVIETPFEPPPPAKFTFIPTDDARVRSSKPDLNYGTSTELRIREASGVQRTYLKFTITGLVGIITSAKLRLYVNDGGDEGGNLHRISNNLLASSTPWDEVALNYHNAPPVDGPLLGSSGPVLQGQWLEFDVGEVVLGNGTYSFGLQNGSTDMVEYSSKEGAHPPELVVEREITITPAPMISSFAPASGHPGAEVTILGKHFLGYTDVLFSGVSASAVSLDSDSQLRAVVPDAGQTGRINIVSPAGTAITASDFEVIGSDTTVATPAPEIFGFKPTRGPVGATVAISGRHFAEIKAVRFDTLSAEYSLVSDSLLIATVPDNAATGLIQVEGKGGTATGQQPFLVEPPAPPPSIATFLPQKGTAGTPVIISGRNFVSVSEVKFGDSPASTFDVKSDSLIHATVPQGAKTGIIEIKAASGNAASSREFVVDPITTGIGDSEVDQIPEEVVLSSNYPNPFNAVTIIEYGLPEESLVNMTVYNLRGNPVKVLLNSRKSMGYSQVSWDGRDEQGGSVSSGIYFVRLRVMNDVFIKKITLQK